MEYVLIPTPYEVYKTENVAEKNFLLGDAGQGRNHIIIFEMESWIHHLADSTWFLNGMFNIAPKLEKRLDGFHTILCIFLLSTYVCLKWLNPRYLI